MFFLKTLPEDSDLLPEYQTTLASGADLQCAISMTLPKLSHCRIPTGVYLDLERMSTWQEQHGFQMIDIQVRGRSSLPHHLGIFQPSVGTVDMDYPAEIFVSLYNPNTESIHLQRGLRIAQIVATKCMRSLGLKARKVKRSKSGGTGI